MDESLFSSPPVVQQAGRHGFTVSIGVSRLCTGWVEWGVKADELVYSAVAAHAGLVAAGDRCLMIPVVFGDSVPSGPAVFYRVVAQPLAYASAYDISRGDSVRTAVFKLTIPRADQARVTLAVVSDTHGSPQTMQTLAGRIEALGPDIVVWNGDVCNQFDAKDDPVAILLRPGAAGAGGLDKGWASARPLLYVPGNHDVRGSRARERPGILAPGPQPDLPYNTAIRLGPLAVIALDTGEDKPDRHPVFAGTAAYERHRERQADWLGAQLTRPEIAEAPFKVAFAHIPLRGLPGENDGTTLEGYARFSGMGAALWLPLLITAGFQAIISGHTHAWRIDEPTDGEAITQVVGGGPRLDEATVIVVEAEPSAMTIRIEDLSGRLLASRDWAMTKE